MKTLNQPIKAIVAKVAAVIVLLTLQLPLCSYADDTAALQTMLNAGDVTLPANATYHVTGLSVMHNFNLNGSTINMTAASGTAIRINAPSITVSNGKIIGTWAVTAASNPNSGTSGIALSANANSVTVSKITVSNFSGYGIVAGPVNHLSILSCSIEKTGFIAFYYDAESIATISGNFCNNYVDRSTIPAANVSMEAVAIRGSTNNGNITSSWTITNNTIKMPVSPKDWSAECIEVRFMNSSKITGNKLIGGSIGLSVVGTNKMTVSSNKISGSQLEGLEFAGGTGNVASTNTIDGSLQAGILLDGNPGSSGMQLLNDTVRNTTQECIHLYKGTSNVTISGCVLTVQTFGVNITVSTNVKIVNTTMDGHGVGSVGISLDTCPGGLTITGGSMKNFTKGPISIYSTTSGLVTDNISMSGTTISNMPVKLISNVSNGAKLGANVVVN